MRVWILTELSEYSLTSYLVKNRIHKLLLMIVYNVCVNLVAVILCKDLLSPDNGRVLYTNTSVASIARYTCDQGYSLSGSASRVCRFNGQWSGIEPTCSKNIL